MATRKLKKKVKRKSDLTPEQKRNSDIFRLRGFYANAKTLPFNAHELRSILSQIDWALHRLDAECQTAYMGNHKCTRHQSMNPSRDREY